MNKNIVLIGMPGSGKTTVGRILAQKMGAVFSDLDKAIEQRAQKPIPQIFAEDGETVFRDLEQQCAQEISCQSGLVVATGGGIVLREANMEALSQNGLIVFLDRPVSEILGENLSDRPLLANDATRIHKLYEERIGLYRRYGQIVIDNRVSAENAASAILDAVRRVQK